MESGGIEVILAHVDDAVVSANSRNDAKQTEIKEASKTTCLGVNQEKTKYMCTYIAKRQ